MKIDMARITFHRGALLFLAWVQLFGRGVPPPDESPGPTDREHFKKLAARVHFLRTYRNWNGGDSPFKQPGGSVLMVTLFVSFILGTMIASLLTLVTFNLQATYRDTTLQAALPIAEAGIEEAFAMVNYDATNDWTHLATGNGWDKQGCCVYHLHRDVDSLNGFDVWITNNTTDGTNSDAVLVSTGASTHQSTSLSRTVVVTSAVDTNGCYKMSEWREQ